MVRTEGAKEIGHAALQAVVIAIGTKLVEWAVEELKKKVEAERTRRREETPDAAPVPP